jgi:hypothetical protein
MSVGTTTRKIKVINIYKERRSINMSVGFEQQTSTSAKFVLLIWYLDGVSSLWISVLACISCVIS